MLEYGIAKTAAYGWSMERSNEFISEFIVDDDRQFAALQCFFAKLKADKDAQAFDIEALYLEHGHRSMRLVHRLVQDYD